MKKYIFLFVLIFSINTFSQEGNLGIKTDLIKIPFGVYQLDLEYILNSEYSLGIEVTKYDLNMGVISGEKDAGNSISIYGRKYLKDNSPYSNYFHAGLRYFDYVQDNLKTKYPKEKYYGAELLYGKQWNIFNNFCLDLNIGPGLFYYDQNDEIYNLIGNSNKTDLGSRGVMLYVMFNFKFGLWF